MTFSRFAPVFLLALLLPLALATAATGADPVIIDQVAAIVNDDVITLSEIDAEGASLLRRILSQIPDPAEQQAAIQKTRQEVLDRLIETTLQQQKATEYGMEVDEAEVESAIARIMEKNNRTKEQFVQDLKKIGTNETQYHQSIKRQMLESRLVNMEVRSKVVITEKMMKEYYDTEYAKEIAPEGYNVLQMGFAWGQTGRAGSRTEALQHAEEVRQQILAGSDFQELARSLSDMPSASNGGAIGILTEDELAPYMRDAILSLKPGEVSALVETEAGFQFFKLLATKEEGAEDKGGFEAVKEDIRNTLYGKEIERLYQSWMDQMREKAYIKKMI